MARENHGWPAANIKPTTEQEGKFEDEGEFFIIKEKITPQHLNKGKEYFALGEDTRIQNHKVCQQPCLPLLQEQRWKDTVETNKQLRKIT